MKTLIPYLTIPKRCEEALNFYQDCFKGEIVFLQRYSETKYPVTPDFKNKITHAEFIAENIHFFVSDGFENGKVVIGSNVALNINFTSIEERLEIFNKLKVDGVVTSELIDTSANSTLLSLIDKFGIHWYLNHNNVD